MGPHRICDCFAGMIRHEDIDNGPITSRLHKGCCCTVCCFSCNPLWRPCRKAVSGSKRRFRENGFDLDLAYVAPRIIVHGFPAAGLEHMYRNPRLEIRRFMDTHHKDHYKVYNFCCEYGRGYDPSVFYGRVERYPFKDHNTPPLETMAAYANSVKAWLDADPANVVNLHCKAGKGRAGLMCCVALIRTGIAQSATEALAIYDDKRVTNKKGLTVTSQRKFVVFYEKMWREIWGVTGDIGAIPAEPLDSTKWVVPEQPMRRLYGIEVLNLPPKLVGTFRVRIFKISNFLPECIYDSKLIRSDSINIDLECALQRNFKIAIQYTPHGSVMAKAINLMELLHNTYFMDWTAENVDFALDQLDTKKKVRPKLGEAIAMRLRFTPTKAQEAAGAVGNGYSLVTSSAAHEDGGDNVGSGVEMTAVPTAPAAIEPTSEKSSSSPSKKSSGSFKIFSGKKKADKGPAFTSVATDDGNGVAL